MSPESDLQPRRFRKRPVVIEAIELRDDNWREVCAFLGWTYDGVNQFPEEIGIFTLEGRMTAKLGDWVIRGVEGELYPCKASVFTATYEEVEHGV